ncbi:helix-turn-helix domain-containing protein [Variovorax ginsengisoli]|jgi:transcriptional regulator with XRE-family HTH domain|uniref:Helix-turn-helix domain-containing protein n=1 Tax=Variovorax ginsengisoli TaxID=363844 RepID=A0ABT8SDH2_9BURK|nr:helix-turn-helix domain-containing protein [Variovorax ginsengisoli]MDN8616321.1 helix-turn-helix domain-containing protein [Variovorax ginsengisoli]MDO1535491.1 helix-turn-helix domain-containing protein [Variovorax ginsengisoli]
MPAHGPELTPQSAADLAAIAATVRHRRKDLKVSAVAAAEAAGLSRVTLHRIEKGESAVTIGAYLRVLAALGLQLTAGLPQQSAEAHRSGWLPARIRIADYPWLRQLAWQVHGPQELTPREALGIYERNWRHLDPAALSDDERDLVESLRSALGSDPIV